jgi:hypothetical protein
MRTRRVLTQRGQPPVTSSPRLQLLQTGTTSVTISITPRTIYEIYAPIRAYSYYGRALRRPYLPLQSVPMRSLQ